MKKIIIIVTMLVLVTVAALAAYYFFFSGSDYGDTRPPKDLTGIVVPPVEFSMKGKTFIVPNASNTIPVTLDLVSPTAKRDYPMARFTEVDGVTPGTLVAQDDFATARENNIQVVPIVVSFGDLDKIYYLALLEGEEMKHVASLLIGEMIKIQTVIRTGDTVTVNYLVHDREQDLTEVPKVATTVIFDIASKQITQAGRIPKNETVIQTKSFSGEYVWLETVSVDGVKIVPTKPDVFTWRFDANRINLGTDCNTGSTNFTTENASSTVFKTESIAQTEMFCESAQEAEYFKMVEQITDYDESKDGTLTFTLNDKAKMIFVPKVKKLEFAASSTEAQ